MALGPDLDRFHFLELAMGYVPGNRMLRKGCFLDRFFPPIGTHRAERTGLYMGKDPD
jgi:hypothetical protein